MEGDKRISKRVEGGGKFSYPPQGCEEGKGIQRMCGSVGYKMNVARAVNEGEEKGRMSTMLKA